MGSPDFQTPSQAKGGSRPDGDNDRWRSACEVARERGRRGRVRDTGDTGLRNHRRAAGRAGHPHDHDPARAGYDVHGGRLRAFFWKAGVALVVPGAGLYNAASGLTNAFARSSPVILIAGQIPRGAVGKNLGAVHEVMDQPGTVRSVTKWQRQASRPRDVPDAVFEAFRQMRTGRPRPVLIEIPPEAGVEREDVQLRSPARISRIVPSREDLEEAARVIGASRTPLIFAGGGVARSDAEGALVRLAEATNIPVVTSSGGRGRYPPPALPGRRLGRPAAERSPQCPGFPTQPDHGPPRRSSWPPPSLRRAGAGQGICRTGQMRQGKSGHTSTSSSSAPGNAISMRRTSIVTSRWIKRPVPKARASMLEVTAPSIMFSIGTNARSTPPVATDSSYNSASSVKVPAGPRKLTKR